MEIMIAVGIATGIFMVIFNFGQSIFGFNATAQSNLEAQTSARRILKTIVKELREASPSSLGAYPVAVAATSTITFFSNIDGDTVKEQVRYFIQGKDFKKGVIKPTGSPLVYNPGVEQVTTLVKDVSNSTSTPIFEYFDSTYTGTSTPLAQPVQVTRVRLVRITFKIEKDPYKAPNVITVISQVFLRNLKDNL